MKISHKTVMDSAGKDNVSIQLQETHDMYLYIPEEMWRGFSCKQTLYLVWWFCVNNDAKDLRPLLAHIFSGAPNMPLNFPEKWVSEMQEKYPGYMTWKCLPKDEQ
jgi:hypothetical protein